MPRPRPTDAPAETRAASVTADDADDRDLPVPAGADARTRMIAAAFDSFHARGIHATSVDDVLRRSGTGKSQLYHYFGSKDGLVLAVVEEFERRLLSGELPGRGELRTADDLERWFGDFVAFQHATGATRTCPMATIAAGLDLSQEPIRQVIERVFDHTRGRLVACFRGMAERGELAPGADPQALADFCGSVMQGGLVVSRVRRDPAPFERAVAEAMRHIRSVVRQP